MVAHIDPVEWDAMRKGKKQIEEMSQFDRELVGADRSRHLVIPMGQGAFSFRRIAGVLHELASDLDTLSRRTDMSARSIVLHVQDSVTRANYRIKEMAGKGKTLKRHEKDNYGDAD
jgi:hypothetical protein